MTKIFFFVKTPDVTANLNSAQKQCTVSTHVTCLRKKILTKFDDIRTYVVLVFTYLLNLFAS